jgi:hypothetical protein
MKVKIITPKYLNSREVLFYQHFFELKRTETDFGMPIIETEFPKSNDGKFDLEKVAFIANNLGFALVVRWNGKEHEAFIPNIH